MAVARLTGALILVAVMVAGVRQHPVAHAGSVPPAALLTRSISAMERVTANRGVGSLKAHVTGASDDIEVSGDCAVHVNSFVSHRPLGWRRQVRATLTHAISEQGSPPTQHFQFILIQALPTANYWQRDSGRPWRLLPFTPSSPAYSAAIYLCPSLTPDRLARPHNGVVRHVVNLGVAAVDGAKSWHLRYTDFDAQHLTSVQDTVDIYVDLATLLWHRLDAHQDITAQSPDGPGSSTVSFTYSRYGEHVHIVPPP